MHVDNHVRKPAGALTFEKQVLIHMDTPGCPSTPKESTPMLSGINGASPWATSASESASYLVEAAPGSYSSSMITEWGASDCYDEVEVASSLPDHPNSGLMVASSLIRSPVFLLLELGSLLTSLSLSGGVVGGVMLMVFVLILILRLAEVSVCSWASAVCPKSWDVGCHFGFAAFWCCSPGC